MLPAGLDQNSHCSVDQWRNTHNCYLGPAAVLAGSSEKELIHTEGAW